MRSDVRHATPSIGVFADLNFIWAGLCGLWFLLMLAVLVYGVGFSGDTGSELAWGVAVTLLLSAPGLLGLLVYLPAGLGLRWHRAWGYYLHCVGAVLAVFTCIGVIYTILAMLFAFRPEFTAVFFPTDHDEFAGKRRRAEYWDED